jgi:hypothetical protein
VTGGAVELDGDAVLSPDCVNAHPPGLPIHYLRGTKQPAIRGLGECAPKFP